MKTTRLILAALPALVLTSSAAEWQPVPGNLMTRWAAKVDPAKPLPEHPRPQLVREAWLNLNGLWQFEIAAKDAPQPARFSQQILVPYPVESALSGIKQRVEPKDRLWYQRAFSVPAAGRAGRVLLHFTVSDWSTEVFVRNLTDKYYSVGGFQMPEQPGNFAVYPGQPRTYGAKLRVNF